MKRKGPNYYMTLSRTCIPAQPPVFGTLVLWGLFYVPEVPTFCWSLMMFVCVLQWLFFIASTILDKEIDIFQHWRSNPEPMTPIAKEPTP